MSRPNYYGTIIRSDFVFCFAYLYVYYMEYLVMEVNNVTLALTIIDVILALALIASVLLQSGKSAGLSGSIAGSAEMLFGGKKKGLDEFLAKVTRWVAGAFLIVSLAVAFFQ